MYPNVKAEMARKKITLSMIAKQLGITPSTLSLKMNGKADFTFREVLAIKLILGVDMPVEELFRMEAA